MEKIKEKIDWKLLKIILISTLIFIVCAHGFCYTNLNFSHDSMRTYFWTRYDTVDIGRYLIPIFLIIKGKYYPPLLVGIITYICVSIICYLLVKMFNIKRKTSIVLTTAIMATASTLTLLNATYIDFSDSYVFCLLLTTIGAYLWRKYKYGFIFSIGFLFLSLGIYQPYISFFTGIVILLLIKDTIDNKKIKDIILGPKGALQALISLIGSLGLYALSLKVITAVTGMGLSDKYNSVQGVTSFTGIDQIIDLLKGTYERVHFYITNPSTYYASLMSILNIGLIIFTVIACIFLIKKNKTHIVNKILFIILVLLIPFALNFVYILGKGIEHQLMIYSFFLLYIFAIMLFEDKKFIIKKNNYPQIFLVLVLSISIFSNIIYANQCYLKKALEFDTTLTTVNRIIDRIEQTKGYKVGETKVAIVGEFNNSQIINSRKELDRTGVGLYPNFSLTYYGTYKVFFDNYLAYPINLVEEEELDKIKTKKEVVEMECFPYTNSIKYVDDVLVVKIADEI